MNGAEAEPPNVDELQLLRPVMGSSGPQDLALFGAVIYEFQVPGIECCPLADGKRQWAANVRCFADVPRYWREWLDKHYREQEDGHHITVDEFERVFGQRKPTEENPEGFPVEPGARLGRAHLFFESEPVHDIIWPQWHVWLLVSERVKDLFERNNVTGLRYHPVATARIVGKSPFRKLTRQWDWSLRAFRENVPLDAGQPWRGKFYELEVIGESADCGLRWKSLCSRCGYSIHDLSNARASGAVGVCRGLDFLNIGCMGRPVCRQQVVDLLDREEVRFFDRTRLSEMIANWMIRESGHGSD